MKSAHVADLLPAYINGTLDNGEDRRVREHLYRCAACEAELASWKAVGEAFVLSSESLPEPSGSVLDLALAEIESGENEAMYRAPSLVSRLSLAVQLLRGQLPLVRREIWIASPLTIGLGCLVALLISSPSSVGSPLAVLAPVVAALGVAFLYGPESDPSLEVALSTPTSPRLVLLARLVLVYGYDLALVLAASGFVALARGGTDLLPLVSLWVGPMLFLSSLALALSLFFGPATGATVAMSLWVAKLLASAYSEGPFAPAGSDLLDAFWRTNPILLPLAVALICLAVAFAPRMERMAP